MANLGDVISMKLNDGVICINNQNNPKIEKMIDELKLRSVKLDIANPTKGQINHVLKNAEKQENSKFLVNVENLYGDGLTNNKQDVVNLLQNKTLPNGDKLPDNAILLIASSDKELENDEAIKNMRDNSALLGKACGEMVELPQKPTKEEIVEIVGAFNQAMKSREKTNNSEMELCD